MQHNFLQLSKTTYNMNTIPLQDKNLTSFTKGMEYQKQKENLLIKIKLFPTSPLSSMNSNKCQWDLHSYIQNPTSRCMLLVNPNASSYFHKI